MDTLTGGAGETPFTPDVPVQQLPAGTMRLAILHTNPGIHLSLG
ncbi:hypothetical protein IDVR_11870 [Intrasporangium sp. DVR]